TLRGEQTARGHLDSAVDTLERQQLFLEQNAGGEQREQLAIRLDVLQRGITQPVLGRQPLQNVFLRPQRTAAGQALSPREIGRLWRRQLPRRHHLVQQLGQARIMRGYLAHRSVTDVEWSHKRPLAVAIASCRRESTLRR